ncbi:uncharacterized protein LOC121373424 [Gigantopelta aegis]|uniref:uncharacterized protein LOC121373424 n=1 Tax=Gigantopelta aegis TaxID=1735272 RepID=UPI001B88A481|nr:uncharacterized protein LOC121373424 [Gigantopelta aegis]
MAATMTPHSLVILCLISSSSIRPLLSMSQDKRVVISPTMVDVNYYLYDKPQMKSMDNLRQPSTQRKPTVVGTHILPEQLSGSARDAQSQLFVPVIPSTGQQVVSPPYVTVGQGAGTLGAQDPVSGIQSGSKNTNSQLSPSGQSTVEPTASSGFKIAEFFVKRLSTCRQGRDILERLGIKQVQKLTSALVRRITRVVYGLKASLSGRDLLITMGLADFMGLPKTSSASPGFLNKMIVLDFAPITLDYRNRAIDDLFVTAYGGLSNYGQEVLSIAPGYITTELDMCLTQEQFNFMYDKRPIPREVRGEFRLLPAFMRRFKRKAIKHNKYRWPTKVIPYEFNYDDFSWSEIMLIERSMYEWEEHTCIRFRMKMSRDVNFIRFRGGVGCSSHVGMIGGGQNITLQNECRIKRIVLHEIGHAIGLIHEHQRPDRDDYIVIRYENASPGTLWDFEKRTWSSVHNYSVPYDYESVMHYGPKAFSRDGVKETILTKDARFQKTIGKVTELSFYDTKVVNLMYNCHAHCEKGITCTNRGFVNRHCECVCPKDKTCEKVKISRTPVRPKNVYMPWQMFRLWPWRVMGPLRVFNPDNFDFFPFSWPNNRRNVMYRRNPRRAM